MNLIHDREQMRMKLTKLDKRRGIKEVPIMICRKHNIGYWIDEQCPECLRECGGQDDI